MLAAQKLFAARGYRGTGVQDIVEEAGVTKPTLYYYYENKAGLYEALLDTAFESRQKLIEQAVAQQSGTEEKLVAVMRAMVEFGREHNELMRIVYGNLFAAKEEVPGGVRSSEKTQQNFEFVHALVREGMATGEISDRHGSMEVTGALYGLFFTAVTGALLQHDNMQPWRGENMVRIFLEGARGRGSEVGEKSKALPVG